MQAFSGSVLGYFVWYHRLHSATTLKLYIIKLYNKCYKWTLLNSWRFNANTESETVFLSITISITITITYKYKTITISISNYSTIIPYFKISDGNFYY